MKRIHLLDSTNIQTTVPILMKNFPMEKLLIIGEKNDKIEIGEIQLVDKIFIKKVSKDTRDPYKAAMYYKNQINLIDKKLINVNLLRDLQLIINSHSSVHSLCYYFLSLSLNIPGWLVHENQLIELTGFELSQISKDEALILSYMMKAEKVDAIGEIVVGLDWADEIETMEKKDLAKVAYSVKKLSNRGYLETIKDSRNVITKITRKGLNYYRLFLS